MKWIKRIKDRLSVKKLYNDLEYFQFIGIAEDIYQTSNRVEYKHLVETARQLTNDDDMIVGLCLTDLKLQLRYPWYKRRSFWVLVKLLIF